MIMVHDFAKIFLMIEELMSSFSYHFNDPTQCMITTVMYCCLRPFEGRGLRVSNTVCLETS